VTNKALTSNVATLTINSAAVANPLAVGDQILVSGVDSTFNTTGASYVTISAVGGSSESWTASYPLTASNVTSASSGGTILVINESSESPAYTAVTDFTGQGSGVSYNVPGNVNFNADGTVDRIIASNEDPTS
jgi:hypothetical protein